MPQVLAAEPTAPPARASSGTMRTYALWLLLLVLAITFLKAIA